MNFTAAKSFHAVLGILFLFITGCSDNLPIDTPAGECSTVGQIPEWETEPFKSKYTIQFPAGYEGSGMVSFEGNTFLKYRSDGKVFMRYLYEGGNGAYHVDFGDSLAAPFPASISMRDELGNALLIDKTRYFCRDSEVIAVLYHNTGDTIVRGNLYMKYEGMMDGRPVNGFFEGVYIKWDRSAEQEVFDIIRTIAPTP